MSLSIVEDLWLQKSFSLVALVFLVQAVQIEVLQRPTSRGYVPFLRSLHGQVLVVEFDDDYAFLEFGKTVKQLELDFVLF